MQHQILKVVMVLVISVFGCKQLQAQTITPSFDNVPIGYEVHGAGKTAVVFVHGWSCDSRYWKEQVTAFSKRYKVITIDLAGHGASGLGRKNYTIESFGLDVAAVVNKLALEHVILVGHSMGGDVVAAAARVIPKDRVTGIVMVDTYKELGKGRTPKEVEDFVAKLRPHFAFSVRKLAHSLFIPSSDPTLVEWVAADMSSAPPEVALSSIQNSFNYSNEITKALAEVKLPVVAINPDNAPTDTTTMQRYGVEVIIVPGLGHFLMMEDPQRFNAVLEGVIETFRK